MKTLETLYNPEAIKFVKEAVDKVNDAETGSKWKCLQCSL